MGVMRKEKEQMDEQKSIKSQEQNEEESKRRKEEEERIKQRQLKKKKRKKIVDERWLFPLFKEAQLTDFGGANHKCQKQKFMDYYIKKKVNPEIIEIIYNSITNNDFIKTKQFFSFKTNFTMQKMRKLLPEFIETNEKIIKSQNESQKRKKILQQKQKQKEDQEKKKKEQQLKKQKQAQKKKSVDLNSIKTI